MITKKQLIIKVLARFIPGFLILAALLFIPAGTIKYWNAWLLFGVFLVPMIFVLFYLLLRNPELLDKRLRGKEKEKEQKSIQGISLFIMLASFILSGLDFRYHWSEVPLFLIIISCIIVFIGYVLFFIILQQNQFVSRIVEIQEKQVVVDTGLYSIVRHPMYLAANMMFLFMPLILGSFYAFVPMFLTTFQMNRRMINEENVLEKGLEGYSDYKKKVKYRVIPYIW